MGTQWRILPLFLLLLLGACTALVVGSPQKRASIRTVGIVSAFADTFDVQKIGMMVFGNDLKTIPISSWGIDDLAAGKVRALLSKRYDVRPVTYQRATIASAKSGRYGIGEAIRPNVSPLGLDAYVVLVGAGTPYGNTNQSLYGLGIVEHAGFQYFLFALYEIVLVDGNDFSFLGLSIASFPNALRGKPVQKVDQSLWPTSLDAASNPRLKEGVIDLIDQTLPSTLQQLQLVD